MTTLYLVFTIALIDFVSILTPGQDFAIVTRNTLQHSRRAGYATVLGIGLVTFGHCLLAMTGLSLLVASNPNLAAFIKTLGALYLIYLGTHFFKNAKNFTPPTAKSKPKQTISNGQAFRMGAIANLLNLEPIMAFISIFAIVLPLETALWIKLIICVLLPLNTMLWLAFITKIFSVQQVQTFLQKRLKTIEQILGFVLVFLGFRTLQSVSSKS